VEEMKRKWKGGTKKRKLKKEKATEGRNQGCQIIEI